MSIHLQKLMRYPVKGLSGQQLDTTYVDVGGAIQFDRAFAIERGAEFDEAAPRFLPKTKFLQLSTDNVLATCVTEFDDATGVITISQNSDLLLRANLLTADGKASLEQFYANLLGDELKTAPRLVQGRGHHFTDVPRRCLSLINRASVDLLAAKTGWTINPDRFRGNLLIDGAAPFEEFRWLGRTINLVGPDGETGAVLEGYSRTVRCAATEVDPISGVRDLALPDALAHHFGHRDMGIYVDVKKAGPIQPGARLELADL